MSVFSVGDRALGFQSLRSGQALKSNLNRLTQELSSGRPADLARHLSGRTADLAMISRDIDTIDGFLAAAASLDLEMTRKQAVLEAVAGPATDLSTRWLSMTPTTPQQQIVRAETDGRTLLDQAIANINERLGGRALFAGAAVDQTPLADGDALMSNLDSVVAGLTDAGAIVAAINQWFSDPVAGFAAVFYGGDTGPQVLHNVSANDSFTIPGRADDGPIRDTLAALSIAAMSGRIADAVSVETRADLLSQAGAGLLPAANGLISLAGDIGAVQARVDASVAYQTAQRTTYAMARNDLVQVDPFDAATALQAAQQQLELHYTATARLARLSLANYL